MTSLVIVFFVNCTGTTEIYTYFHTLSLHDALPIFLVSADLGASFDNVQRTKRGIKDLYIGARDLDLTVRLLNTYPIRVFTKKDTNERIVNRTISVYDAGGSIKVRLWDNLTHVIEENNLKTGDLIKIRSEENTSEHQ